MTAATEVISYGDTTVVTDEGRLSRRRDGLDTLSGYTVSSDDPNLFNPDGVAPGFPGMLIDVVDRENDCGGYIYRLDCIGIAGTKPRRRDAGYPRVSRNLEGLDEASDSWLQTGNGGFALGSTLSGYANMYCVSVEEEPLHGTYFRMSPRYQGLIGSKPYKRTISVNGQIVTPGSPFVNNLPNGWDSAQYGQFELPKVMVSDFRVQIGAPDTTKIPGRLTPPDPPDISDVVVFEGFELTYVWPSGWKIADINGSFIAGTDVWVGTISYEFAWPALPK